MPFYQPRMSHCVNVYGTLDERSPTEATLSIQKRYSAINPRPKGYAPPNTNGVAPNDQNIAMVRNTKSFPQPQRKHSREQHMRLSSLRSQEQLKEKGCASQPVLNLEVPMRSSRASPTHNQVVNNGGTLAIVTTQNN